MASFKDYFKTDDFNLFVEMDFSQLEVCGLAEHTGDPVLIKELNDGVDIHRANAALWLHKEPSEVTDKERKLAKIMTFQLQYGAGAPKIAKSLGIKVIEAFQFIEAFYKKYVMVSEWHKSLLVTKVNTPINSDILLFDHCGRKYVIEAKKDKKGGDKYFSLPEMKNYPIQGFSTGGIVPVVTNMIMENLVAMEVLDKIMPVNTIHDSLMFELHASYVQVLFRAIENAFRDLPQRFYDLFDHELKVVYNYDIKIGQSWGDMDKYTRSDIQYLLST